MEFLPDELVEYDVDEFVPDEFVLDEGTTDSNVGSVGFAGPSDAPPPYPATRTPLIRASRPAAGVARRATRSLRSRWIALAFASAAGLVTVALMHRGASVQPAAPPPAASAGPSSDMAAVPESVSPSAETERAAPADAADHPSVDAVDLKQRAQQALEKGKLAPAIDLGQQAVEADPTDAESWLILGATYLQRGKYGDARRCFASCVERATHGPTSECKALLR